MNKNILVLCICIYVLVCVCMISYGIIPEVRARGCGQGVSRVWHCQETTFSDVGDGNMGSWALRLQQQSHYKDGRRGYKPSEETVQHSTLLFKRAVSNSINDKIYQGACVCVCYTISDFLKVPGLYKLWLHTFKPPEKLSNEDHHIILQDTMITSVGTRYNVARACF